ncbi:acyl-CoA dehydrogenase family protein [Planomonospora algeriensis]
MHPDPAAPAIAGPAPPAASAVPAGPTGPTGPIQPTGPVEPAESTGMGLTEDQADLRDAVRAFLAGRPGAPWDRFARELGVAGLAVPEEYGGAGCGAAEQAVVCEELGRVLSSHPYLATAVLAVEALRAAADPRRWPGCCPPSPTAPAPRPSCCPATPTWSCPGDGSPAPRPACWTARWSWPSPATNWSRPCPRPARR